MKNVFLAVCLIAIIFPITITADAQTGKEANLSPLINFNTSHIMLLQMGKDAALEQSAFLKSINSQDAINTDSPANKMGLGVINATTSWTEIPRQATRVSEEHNLLLGYTLGFGEGIVSGVARGVSGAFDVVTFALPPYDKPLMEPEYKVERPNQGFKIDLLKW